MPNAKHFDDIFNMPIGQNKNGDEDLFPESLTFDEEGKELLEVEYQATPFLSEGGLIGSSLSADPFRSRELGLFKRLVCKHHSCATSSKH